MSFLSDVIAATFRNATPLVYGTVGETYCERAGILNLGIEGTMYAGAFFGFLVAQQTGSLLLGLAAAIGCGLGAGLLMGLLTVTFGANQHVSGLGLTLFLIGAAEFVNRLQYKGSQEQAKVEPYATIDVFGIDIFSQYALTYIAFLVVVPLAALGSFTLNIIAGRGWVCIALVIFGRWRIGRGVLGALLFAFVYALQLRLRILPSFSDVPFELLLALPYVVVILALALSGRNVAYPGAYLKPYRRA